uniref:Uncharacterized protein n=1 Tax=Acrobeloides nanus TaxID=290746 RepID=A0A914ER11_9BILA
MISGSGLSSLQCTSSSTNAQPLLFSSSSSTSVAFLVQQPPPQRRGGMRRETRSSTARSRQSLKNVDEARLGLLLRSNRLEQNFLPTTNRRDLIYRQLVTQRGGLNAK